MNAINLRVSVPVCSFRKPYAREYLETERVPPPATVYGFLLSLVGEEDRYEYIGTKLALAITCAPAVSTVLRTAWHVKNRKVSPGTGSNRRPDYQEVLTGLQIGVWVLDGALAQRLRASQSPENITRYGGLCLGESRDLVDEVVFSPSWSEQQARWLVRDDRGEYPLPVWVDHVGSKGTRWGQFRLHEAALQQPREGDPRWITIEPPEASRKK